MNQDEECNYHAAVEAVEAAVEAVEAVRPTTRETSLALTKLEEAEMWLSRVSVVRVGVKRKE